jgi:hypothetical protein
MNEERARHAWIAVLRGYSRDQVLALRSGLLTRDNRLVFNRVCVPHPHRPHWHKEVSRVCPELFPLLADGTIRTVQQASRAFTMLEARLGILVFDAADFVAELPAEVARRRLIDWCTQAVAYTLQGEGDPFPHPEPAHEQAP